MTVWAGVDIGNATTEVVLCTPALEVLASARTPTRGGKGSVRAIQNATQLVRRLADSHGLVVDRAAFAPTPPVHSAVERVQLAQQRTGRLTIATRSAATTAGDAAGVGVPVPVDQLGTGPERPLVACAGPQFGYADVAAFVNSAVAAGRNVVAVLTANDEAVLVSNRLTAPLPVVDDVDVAQMLAATLIAVEVREGVSPLQRLTDPFWLADAFELGDDERDDARVVADRLFDSVCAVVTLGAFPAAVASVPAAAAPSGVSHVVHLADIAAQANSRRGSVALDSLVQATMGGDGATPADADALAEVLGVPVTRIDSEAEAARAGALTTSGIPPDVVVVDVGGGTVDVVAAGHRIVLPGAGQLLTTATAAALDISTSAAEYAKRAEAVTAVTVHLVEDEHGRRRFLDTPIDGRCTGWLLATAPSGLLPFTSALSGAEWRSWRLAAKRLVIGANVLTGIEQAAPDASGALLVGGGASDDELVRAVSEQLGQRITVGRGNVVGQLGHRFAVAYGLVALAVG